MQPPTDRRPHVLLAWALALFAITGVVALGVRPLAVPDEARYGAIASEMLERGDWIALRLGGFHWLEKPPLAIWGIAASISVFGENAFAIRLPSVLGGLMAAVGAGWVAVRVTRRRELLPLAMAVQATTVGPLVFGTVAITDGLFAGLVSLTMAAWFDASTSAGRRRLICLALTGALAGLAFLCKGFLAMALPAAAAGLHLIWQRRFRDLLVLPWIPMSIAVLVAVPWAMEIHRREPRFWEFFIEYVHLRRAVSPDSIHHPEPWWLYAAILPLLGLFWTLLWPKAVAGLRNTESQDGVRFMIAWLVGPLLVLSASSGKLPTYTLPLFPPLSAMLAVGLMRAHEQGRLAVGTAERVARWLLMAAALLAVVFALTGTAWSPVPDLWTSHVALRWLVVAGALVAWAVIDRWSWTTRLSANWLLRTASAPALALACIPFLFPDAIVRGTRHPWALLEAAHAPLTQADCVIATAPLAHAVIWQTRRRDLLIAGSPAEFDGGMQPPEDLARLVPEDRLVHTIRRRLAADGTGGVALVAPVDNQATGPASDLPEPATRLERDGVVVLVWRQR